MIKGQRFFEVIEPDKEPSFFGGLKEIADTYGLTYSKLVREVNRDGKTYYTEKGITITAVYFRIKN